MNEMVDVLQEILEELREMNSKLDDMAGIGMYNSIADVCDKLDSIQTSLDSIELAMD